MLPTTSVLTMGLRARTEPTAWKHTQSLCCINSMTQRNDNMPIHHYRIIQGDSEKHSNTEIVTSQKRVNIFALNFAPLFRT